MSSQISVKPQLQITLGIHTGIQPVFRRIGALLSVALFTLCFSSAALSLQIDEVTVPDKVTLPGTDIELQLNGAGYRTKFVFNIYVGALYTEKKVDSRDAAQALTGPKRVLMHMVYDEVEREKITNGWNEGFEENNSDDQLEKLKSRLTTFNGFFPDLKAGDVLTFDYVPDSGTHVFINGKEKGVIQGADFYAALLDVWLGDEPADDDLKEAMLGEGD